LNSVSAPRFAIPDLNPSAELEAALTGTWLGCRANRRAKEENLDTLAVFWSLEDEWTRYAIKIAERAEMMTRRMVAGEEKPFDLLVVRGGCP
jgi:hypothetical protein